MKEVEVRFTGSVAHDYDRLLVPILFSPYAQELVERARQLDGRKILETAAGTGVVTKALHEALPEAELIATDLNEPMLEVARKRLGSDEVRLVQANAEDLSFADSTFDLVVCQFGAMFFPDKIRGHAQARRVLREGGHYLLAIWDRLELNGLSNAAQQVLIDLFPEDPPLFMREGPYGYHEPERIEGDLHEAGFRAIKIETVELRSRSPSAHDAATAFCCGTPMRVEIEERAPGCLDRVLDAVEQAFRSFESDGRVDAPMAAHIVTATR